MLLEKPWWGIKIETGSNFTPFDGEEGKARFLKRKFPRGPGF